MEVAGVPRFLGKHSRTHVASLEARMEAEDGSGIEYRTLVGDSSTADPQSRANLQNLRAQLADVIG